MTATPITEVLEWHDATLVKPDSDMTVLCWIDDDFFCGYWDDSIPGWIACESGGSVIGVTHWATPGGPHGDHFRDGTKMIEPAERDEGAITQEQINEILIRGDHAFRAFVERFDSKCWARYDLSALHLGWHFGKGAETRAAWRARQEATKIEREACADLCEQAGAAMAWGVSALIRARSNAEVKGD
ncbi:MAG TPA: hypothetical protein PKZ27_14955 [Rhodocyclaceae bacterium]|nr:hypothetical protein [Rhodocyclaceae bacterium]